MAALARLKLAERRKLPERCRTIARHGSRKISHGDRLGCPKLARVLLNTCSGSRGSAPLRSALPDLGNFYASCGASLANSDPNRSVLTNLRPLLAKFGQPLIELGPNWSMLTNFGMSAKFGQHVHKLDLT